MRRRQRPTAPTQATACAALLLLAGGCYDGLPADGEGGVVARQDRFEEPAGARVAGAPAPGNYGRFFYDNQCEAADTYYQSEIGIWYTLWWRSAGQNHNYHWDLARMTPERGRYGVNNDSSAVIHEHLDFFAEAGVDYILFDQTNSLGNNDNTILHNMEDMIAIMDDRSEPTPQYALALGGAMKHLDWPVESRDKEIEFVQDRWSPTDAYYEWAGKPLLVSYGLADWFHWTHPDFAVRYAAGNVVQAKDRLAELGQPLPEHGIWGWVFNDDQPDAEVYGINPGYNKRFPVARRGGEHYKSEWLRALKQNKPMVLLAGWNDFNEEVHIEAASPVPRDTYYARVDQVLDDGLIKPSKHALLRDRYLPENHDPDDVEFTDSYGNPAPYLYEEITKGYVRLKYGLVPGYFYKTESAPEVYRFERGTLIHQNSMPVGHPIIRVPDDYFDWFFDKTDCFEPPHLTEIGESMDVLEGLFKVGNKIYKGYGEQYCDYGGMGHFLGYNEHADLDTAQSVPYLPLFQTDAGRCDR